MGWPNGMAEWDGRIDSGIRTHGFKPWSSQTNDLENDTCRFLLLASSLALLGQDKDWLAECPDNVSEWVIRSWC